MRGDAVLAVGGENLIDLVSGAPAPGDLPTYVANPGGSPFNVALAAARQGLDVAYLTPVSTDSLGELVAARLDECGAVLAGPRVDQPTSLAVVSLENGSASYSFHRNGTAERQVSLRVLQQIMPGRATALHVGSNCLVEGDDAQDWEAFFIACHSKGLMTSLDPNIRPGLVPDRDHHNARLRRMLGHADIVKLSDEDLEWMYPGASLDESLAKCRADCPAPVFILTLGTKGARGFAGDVEVAVDAAPVDNLVDTVGAGDTFMASILAWCFEREHASRDALAGLGAIALREAMMRAAKAAAINCGRAGCDPPRLSELVGEQESV